MTSYRVEVWTGGGTRLLFRTTAIADSSHAWLVYADLRHRYRGAGHHVTRLTYENAEGDVSVVARDQ